MVTRLKVCCIASVEEARLAVAHGASALGLVSAMPSGPGVIEDSLIAQIVATVPPPVATFLLTCEVDEDRIVAQLRASGAGTIQLVDAVPFSAYRAIRSELPSIKIVQVIHVEDEGAIEQARAAAEHADALLLDSGSPKAATKILGGTGRTHNWSLSRRIVETSLKPVFLAGGINPGNAREAIDQVRPFGLDLCSGVRTNERLDAQKLKDLVGAMGPAGPE